MTQAPYPSLPLLLVDDEPQILLSFSVMLRTAGINNLKTIEDSREVMPQLSRGNASVILLDLSMPHMPGIRLLTEVSQSYPQIPVIVVTATDNIETAVECMKSGAFDYLVKPVETSRFLSSVRRALEMAELRNEVSSLKQYLLNDRLEHKSAFSSLVTGNKKMRALFLYVEAIATSHQPVLITGETGVGKELFAKAVHNLSGRKGDFVAVNIAGLDDVVFSDTLFGHKKGAFTGADQTREGLIAQAFGGTLFLDEIGDLNEASQVKLLRLIQEQKYFPLGSDIPRQTNTRIVVATNHDIQDLLRSGRFRRDLYYRLRAHHINIPALRERREDIPLLLDYFLDEAAGTLQKKSPSYPPELVTLLSNYHFPGNVRELQAMVFDAVARHRSGMISMESFREVIKQDLASEQISPKQGVEFADFLSGITGRFPTLKEAEDYLISEALRLSNNNQGIAASLLGLTRQALNKRLVRQNRSE
ncbi:MAG: sigma-54-dependent Fis family transcriptional regulator [Nitrospirae bacterium]|nr:sigma-54-dependent Fis family transcriptional regulator [Nitrospirota bacterium]